MTLPLFRIALPLALGFSLVAASPHVHGKEDKKAEKEEKRRAQQEALSALQRGEILPLARILEIAQGHVKGDIIEVEYKAGPRYEVKILMADGQIKEVKLDARTGALIKIEND